MILTSKAEFPVTFGEITIPKGQDHLTAEERDEGYVGFFRLLNAIGSQPVVYEGKAVR
jgi:hypothetical protein